ncbi:hypothetical protein K435DRAFT_802917 [Dendrothele bispora CBS 962.96]|uniref:Uncharacterized protein n=1 Tax=Dendrothele bispora (strain CBS 962.96) TaxID=1314807 RepID=A0A4S8LJG4_DENBC|nr:hypothetical protein K435DRAFT_802917 [Dendrothele bispora CBS 962.96]
MYYDYIKLLSLCEKAFFAPSLNIPFLLGRPVKRKLVYRMVPATIRVFTGKPITISWQRNPDEPSRWHFNLSHNGQELPVPVSGPDQPYGQAGIPFIAEGAFILQAVSDPLGKVFFQSGPIIATNNFDVSSGGEGQNSSDPTTTLEVKSTILESTSSPTPSATSFSSMDLPGLPNGPDFGTCVDLDGTCTGTCVNLGGTCIERPPPPPGDESSEWWGTLVGGAVIIAISITGFIFKKWRRRKRLQTEQSEMV